MGVFHSNARTIRNLDIHSKSDYVIVVYLVDEQFVVSTYLTLVFFYELFRYSAKYRPFFFACSHQHHVKTKVFSSLLISHFLHLADVPYYSDFH